MFSERLKELRKERKITQEKLAAIIGVERSSVGKYESTNTIPSIETLKIISNFFGVSTDYLLGNSEQKEKPAEDTASVTEEDIKFALFKGSEDITDEMYEEVKQFAQFIKNRKKD